MKKYAVLALASLLSLVGMPAFAAAVDVTALTAAVDFSTVNAALLAVAAIMIGVYIVWRAAKFVLHAVKSL